MRLSCRHAGVGFCSTFVKGGLHTTVARSRRPQLCKTSHAIIANCSFYIGIRAGCHTEQHTTPQRYTASKAFHLTAGCQHAGVPATCQLDEPPEACLNAIIDLPFGIMPCTVCWWLSMWCARDDLPQCMHGPRQGHQPSSCLSLAEFATINPYYGFF